MALPSSGTITMAAIAAEIGVALPIGLTDSNVRTLCQVPSGTVTMPTHFYGKSWKPVPSLTNGSINGQAYTDGFGQPVTAQGSDSVTVSAGSSPYTYQWYYTGGAGNNGTTSSTLTLKHISTTPSSVSGTYYCTVTGANGASANTATGTYYLEVSDL